MSITFRAAKPDQSGTEAARTGPRQGGARPIENLIDPMQRRGFTSFVFGENGGRTRAEAMQHTGLNGQADPISARSK
jgi:hypothetical protein